MEINFSVMAIFMPIFRKRRWFQKVHFLALRKTQLKTVPKSMDKEFWEVP